MHSGLVCIFVWHLPQMSWHVALRISISIMLLVEYKAKASMHPMPKPNLWWQVYLSINKGYTFLNMIIAYIHDIHHSTITIEFFPYSSIVLICSAYLANIATVFGGKSTWSEYYICRLTVTNISKNILDNQSMKIKGRIKAVFFYLNFPRNSTEVVQKFKRRTGNKPVSGKIWRSSGTSYDVVRPQDVVLRSAQAQTKPWLARARRYLSNGYINLLSVQY